MKDVKLYGFRKNGELVKEDGGYYAFFPTFDDAELELRPHEKVVIVRTKIPATPKEDL